jgi:hypothetical protein
MHIMTSALDVARDVMVPSIERGRFRTAVMCLCPYSVQAISLPLTICGIEGFLIGYASGNCMDYREWLEADGGLKKETTALSAGARDTILSLLQTAAEQREKEGVRYHSYVRRGNIFVPNSG